MKFKGEKREREEKKKNIRKVAMTSREESASHPKTDTKQQNMQMPYSLVRSHFGRMSAGEVGIEMST